MKLWKKILIGVGTFFLVLITVFLIIVVRACNYGENYDKKAPLTADVKHKDMVTIKSIGRGLYDKDGNLFQMKGVNYGNWLIQEGWMSVNSLGAKYNEDGSFYKVNDQGIVEEYEEVYQEDLDSALANNPNLTTTQIELLWDAYYKSYCQEEDFKNIKDLGLNMIRLPMYYRTFLEGPDDNLVMKDDAFKLVDWFLEMAKKYDLVVVLDMHGVVGGQSGFEHSGTRKYEFWTNKEYQDVMCELWKQIALHYKEERPDLAYTIAAYDLVNEPATATTSTGKKQWDVMDKMYDAIRSVDEDHVIAFEGCWYFTALPDPKDYGWENVLYEYHCYNWNRPTVTNEMFYTLQWQTLSMADYEVPKYMGEFTFFDEKDEWIKWLNQFDEMGFSWSFWSYKTVCVGWWDMSWGIYVNKLNLQNEVLKLDCRTATYDEIYAVWSKQGTSEAYKNTGVMKEVLELYFSQFK